MEVYVEYGIDLGVAFQRDFPLKNVFKTPGGFHLTEGFRVSRSDIIELRKRGGTVWIVALVVVGFTLYAFYAWAFLIRHRVRISYLERDYYELEEKRARLLIELEETGANEHDEVKKELKDVEVKFARLRNAYNEEVEKFNRKLKSPLFFIPAKLFGEKPIDKMD